MSRGQTYVFQFGAPVPVHRIFWFTRTGAPNELALNHKIIQNRKLQSHPSSQTNHFCSASYCHNFRIDGEISFWNEFCLVAFISKK